MKPTKDIDSTYVPAGSLDVNDLKVALALNLTGLLLLLPFGWLFTRIAGLIRPDISSGEFLNGNGNAGLLILILSLLAILVIHELIHGAGFWLYTGERPKFGFHILYAYAAAPAWYIPRNKFAVIGLSPLILITLAGLALLAWGPASTVWLVSIILTVNAAGSIGDLVMVGWTFRFPPTLLIHDSGTRITLYKKSTANVASLNRCWLELILPMQVDEEKARLVFADLVKQYSAEGRYYHNLAHVAEILDTLESLRDHARDFQTIQLAAWFHDVVYDPKARDNEHQSALYAERTLRYLNLPETTIARVKELVLATTTHRPMDGDHDIQILLDADLAPLGSEQATFRRQSDAIRQEFAHVPEPDYQAGRIKVMHHFLDRDRIYLTDPLFESLERQARENLIAEIERLS